MNKLEDLYGPLDEKKKKRKKTKRKGGKKDGKGSSKKGYTLRDWFKGGGWVQTGGKYDGKPCAKQPGQKTKPYCRDPDDRAKMSKKERDKRAAKKRREDPNPERRGKAKNVKQKKSKRKSKKNEGLYMDLEQMIREELKQVNEGMGTAILATTLVFALATKLLGRKPKSDEEAQKAVQNISDEDRLKLAKEVAQQAINDMESQMSYEEFADAGMPDSKPATNLGFDRSAMKPARSLEEIVQEELEAVLDEKRKKKKKKKKKKAKRDACYHKVKSRYKVWPSAYASGALVKCRRVGAKNWGNSKKESVEIDVQNTILEVLNESHSKEDEEKLKDIAKALRNSSKMHGEQAEEIQGIVDRSPNDELDESHSEADEETLEDIAGQLRKASKLHAGQAKKIQKIVDDSDDSELREEEEQITESPNCGCGNDPCDSYGKNGEKLVIMVKEEIEAVMKERQLSEQELDKEHILRRFQAAYEEVEDDPRSVEDNIDFVIRDEFPAEPKIQKYLQSIRRELIQKASSGALEEKKKKKKKKSAKDRMKCNSSRRIRKGEPGYGKKKFVVKACEGGTEKIIRYGDANMEIKKDSPARRKSFRARHNCKNPGSKLKARYWSCKKW